MQKPPLIKMVNLVKLVSAVAYGVSSIAIMVANKEILSAYKCAWCCTVGILILPCVQISFGQCARACSNGHDTRPAARREAHGAPVVPRHRAPHAPPGLPAAAVLRAQPAYGPRQHPVPQVCLSLVGMHAAHCPYRAFSGQPCVCSLPMMTVLRRFTILLTMVLEYFVLRFGSVRFKA